ncbi:MAG: ABC transporter permease subunit [Candidatus Aminicenantia bacterium]
MRNILAIAQKELKVYFVSPMAYVLIGVFLLISGFFFYNILMYFNLQSIQYGANPYYGSQLNINQFVYSSYFHNTSIILLLILPLLTMRLFAEEKRLGTDELLFTSPLSTWQIVIGKFISAVVILLIMLIATGIYSIFTFLYGNPQLEPILTGYLGLLLLGSAFIAIGIFTSSLTENQIVAAVLGFGTLLLFWVISWASDNVGPLWRGILTHLSIFEHFEDMVKGVVDAEDLVYYVSLAFFGLFIAHFTIEAKKWR